jgi:hypothetical protein
MMFFYLVIIFLDFELMQDWQHIGWKIIGNQIVEGGMLKIKQ